MLWNVQGHDSDSESESDYDSNYDSDYASDVDSRRSMTGYVFTLGDSVGSWKATQLRTVLELESLRYNSLTLTFAAQIIYILNR